MQGDHSSDSRRPNVLRRSSSSSELGAEDIERTELQLKKWSHRLLESTVQEATGLCSEHEFQLLRAPSTSHIDKHARSCDVSFYSMLCLLGGCAGPRRVINSCRCVHGAVVLRGSMEDQPSTFQDALQQALSEIWHPVAGSDAMASIFTSQHTDSDGMVHISDKGQRFFFEAMFSDPAIASAVREILQLEAAAAGALKLLPALASHLPEVGRLSMRIEVGW